MVNLCNFSHAIFSTVIPSLAILIAGCQRGSQILEGIVAESESFYLSPSDEFSKPVFVLSNRGSGSVRILRVDSSCGCAVPSLTQSTISAGESLEIAVEMSRPPVGVKSASIVVTTDSAVTPELRLEASIAAKGHGRSAVTNKSPDQVWLIRWNAGGNLPSRDDIRVSQVVVSTIEPLDKSFKSDLMSDLDDLIVRTTTVEQSGQLFGSEFVQPRYHFDVALRDAIAPGERKGRLFCCLADGTSTGPMAEIPVEVFVVSAITSQPSSLFAALDPNGTLPSWSLVIDTSRMDDYSIPINVSSDQDWLTVTVSSDHSAENTDKKLVVAVSVSQPRDEDTGTIDIRCGDDTLLVIPVLIQGSQ